MLFTQICRKVTTKIAYMQVFLPFFAEKVFFFLRICGKKCNFVAKT